MNYLVTGATGGFGGAALNKLKELVPTSVIHVLVRDEEKAKPLADEGFTVHIGDYADYDSLLAAFEDIDRLLFISSAPGNRQSEHENVVKATKETGVDFIAYTSFPKAESSSATLASDHKFTEKLIEELGINHTFLRNNWYLENETLLAELALGNGKFVYSAEDGRVGWALRREYAEAAAIVLAGEEEYPEILELAGPTIDYATLAEELKQFAGKEFEVVQATDDEFVGYLVEKQVPQEGAQAVASIQEDIRNEALNVPSDDLQNILDQPLTPLKEAFNETIN